MEINQSIIQIIIFVAFMIGMVVFTKFSNIKENEHRVEKKLAEIEKDIAELRRKQYKTEMDLIRK